MVESKPETSIWGDTQKGRVERKRHMAMMQEKERLADEAESALREKDLKLEGDGGHPCGVQVR